MPPGLEPIFGEDDRECSRLLLLLAESKGRRVDQIMVNAAWNFENIDRNYRDHLGLLARFRELGKRASPAELADWTARESRSWRRALAADPLLPDELLPSGYLGKTAFLKRQETFDDAAPILAEIRPSLPP